MKEDEEKPPLADAIRHLAERERRSLTEHPTARTLAAYHARELRPESEARVQEHLAVCRHCSDLLLDLGGFEDLKPPEGMPELTDEQVEEDWQALRSRMQEEEGRRTAEVVPIRPVGPAPKPGRTYSPWLPVAASLLAVLGFSFGLYQSTRVGALREQVEEQSKPSSATSLTLVDEPVRSEEQAQRMPSQDWAVLFLYPRDEETYPAYEAEITGHPRIPAGGLQEDRVVLLLPPRSLGPGKHEIRLFGVKGDQRVQVGTYNVQVDAP